MFLFPLTEMTRNPREKVKSTMNCIVHRKTAKTVQAHQVNIANISCRFHSRLLTFNFTLGVDDEETAAVPAEIDPNLAWPSMQDLNTRLRRVITSYQRNYKKEELKQQQKAKVGIFHWFSQYTYGFLGYFFFSLYVEVIILILSTAHYLPFYTFHFIRF